MSLKGQALLLTLILGWVTPSTLSAWIDTKDLIKPLEGCQFVLTTSGQWGRSFPPIGDAILSAIREMSHHVRLLSTLKDYRRTQSIIRHQFPRIVHLSLHPPPAVATRTRCDIPLMTGKEKMSVHTLRDAVILFVDKRIRPTRGSSCTPALLRKWPCGISNTYVIVPFSGVHVSNNPLVQLARRGLGPRNVVTHSSKKLRLRIVGASFVELVEGITRLRMDFHNDTLKLRYNGSS